MKHYISIETTDPSWHTALNDALNKMDPAYLENLYHTTDWLPGPRLIFNAFSLPLDQTQYVLLGESPYPRSASANGYAFWDAAVNELWSETGLAKPVNRATSLRNIIKMLLIAEGKLNADETTQLAISQLNKHALVKTNADLFNNFLSRGFLLLNTTPVLRPRNKCGASSGNVQKDAKAWHPFISHVLNFIFENRPHAQLILLGNIANAIDKLITRREIKRFYAEHPYNISFINNPKVIDFFRPLHLLTICHPEVKKIE